MKVCAITTVYNEAFNLPIWLRHYGKQVGIENCIVVDHGSDDGSTDSLLGAERIRIPRSEYSETKRVRLAANLVASMLDAYDAVVYSDCDELLMADPEQYANLADFAERMEGPAATAIGLNIMQKMDVESALISDQQILAQRRHVGFVAPMCKTTLVRERPTWGTGFHRSNFRPAFNGLYLFHLRWADLGESLRRLSITRNVAFENLSHAAHHRLSNLEFMGYFEGWSRMSVRESFDFSDWVSRAISSVVEEGGLFSIDQKLRSDALYHVPERFVGAF
jgi:glycosyltransferase involved in cell wall biosynthesis